MLSGEASVATISGFDSHYLSWMRPMWHSAGSEKRSTWDWGNPGGPRLCNLQRGYQQYGRRGYSLDLWRRVLGW